MSSVLQIATRQSPLALWQSEMVASLITKRFPGRSVELLKIVTEGDRILDRSLAAVGGKGLFIKELETALLDNRAQLAVHSMKDVPAEMPEGFCIAAVLARANPLDAWISHDYAHPLDLPPNAVVGTSSLRRHAQLIHLRPDLRILPLRGNVGTRLAKLDGGEYAAIVLAAAGLERLGLTNRIRCLLSLDESLPAVGQGIVGIECLANSEIRELLAVFNDRDAHDCLIAERAVARQLGASCTSPLAAHATLHGNTLNLTALAGNMHGHLIKVSVVGERSDAQQIGIRAATALREQGALTLLAPHAK